MSHHFTLCVQGGRVRLVTGKLGNCGRTLYITDHRCILHEQDLHRHGRRVGARPRGGRGRSSPRAAASSCSTSMRTPAASAEQALGASARFAQADVTSEEQVQAAIELARSAFGGLHGVVNAAGIGPAAKVLGKNGPHALDLFEKTIRVNLVGTFNVIRLAAAAIATERARGERRARRHHQHRVDRRVRRPDRPARLRRVERRHRRADAAGRARVRGDRHSRRDDRAGHLRHAAPGGAARSRARVARSAGAVSVAARDARPNTPRSCAHIIENEMLNGEVIRLDGALPHGAAIARETRASRAADR